jgi:DNA repair photolyase
MGAGPEERPRGRGAATNPPNRFERIHVSLEPPEDPQERIDPRTHFLKDRARSIIATNDSPDLGFSASLNPYRGCEHGCAYCFARPTHEFLGFSSGLDFETRILVKEDAPSLLREALSRPGWAPQPVVVSGVTDAYQPVERRLELTRRCLGVLAEFRNPVAIVTKNFLVTRDLDLLADLARDQAAAVFLSITTLDAALARTLEPRTSTPGRRLQAIEKLARAGIPVGVNVAPVIPGLTDSELPSILAAAGQAGARHGAFSLLRLPLAVAPLFQEWLASEAPGRKEKVLHRIREVRGGRLNDPRFGSRMSGEGEYARQIEGLFRLGCRQARISRSSPVLSTAAFRLPPGPQLTLFEPSPSGV